MISFHCVFLNWLWGLIHRRIFKSSRERNWGNAWSGLGSLVNTYCFLPLFLYPKSWHAALLQIFVSFHNQAMILMFIFSALNILWFGLFNLLFAFSRSVCILKAKTLWRIKVHLYQQYFSFSLDHYYPFFDSSSSLASDLDTAAQIDTFITGTVVDNCLAARLLTWD